MIYWLLDIILDAFSPNDLRSVPTFQQGIMLSCFDMKMCHFKNQRPYSLYHKTVLYSFLRHFDASCIRMGLVFKWVLYLTLEI